MCYDAVTDRLCQDRRVLRMHPREINLDWKALLCFGRVDAKKRCQGVIGLQYVLGKVHVKKPASGTSFPKSSVEKVVARGEFGVLGRCPYERLVQFG